MSLIKINDDYINAIAHDDLDDVIFYKFLPQSAYDHDFADYICKLKSIYF